MTTPREVLDQALAMTSGSRLERARAGMQALASFGRLSASDKRDLAVLVAQRTAPDLVPRIQAEGGVDLTEEQSRAVMDMVARLDGDDLAELRDVVATPEARQQALASVGTAAATATGLDDVVAEPGTVEAEDATATGPADASAASSTPEPVLDEAAERHRARIGALERQLEDLREQLADTEEARREAEEAREQAEEAAAAARADAATERRRATRQAEATERAEAAAHATEERLRTFRDHLDTTSNVQPTVASVPVAAVPVTPVTTTPEEVDRLLARLRDARPSEALRLLVVAASSVAGMDPGDRRAMLAAVPDGWARQRSLQRLVEADAIPSNEALDLLDLLSSTGSQVFAATSMLQVGLVGFDDLVAALEPAAVTRLQRRRTA